ncbi:MAG: hypothetical protein ACTSR8_04785 [Promethearchaeota archaeon]
MAFIWLFIFLISLISTGFFFSSFLDTKKALVMSLGLMIFFYIMGVYAPLFGEDYEDIQIISIFHYFDTAPLLNDNDWENVYQSILILTIYSIIFTSAGVLIFNLRDIPV